MFQGKLKLIKCYKTNKRPDIRLFFVLSKVVTSYQGDFEDRIALTEVFQGDNREKLGETVENSTSQ